ncbi:MAG: hypothetical protein OEV66_10845, partial [Spirochaetia bacterium]|nr:hypothetical protein [Spirochaetia bacterium]
GSHEYRFILEAGSLSNTLIFPEYFTFPSAITSPEQILGNSQDTVQSLLRLSLEPELSDTMIVGGTILLEKNGLKFNATPVICNGRILDYYLKRNLFLKEREFLSGGNQKLILSHPATNNSWGFLVCADVQSPEYFMQYKGVQYLAIPVASPYLPDDTSGAQQSRDKSIFMEGARLCGAVLFKCCLAAPPGLMENIPLTDLHSRVQGRSLIADSKSILVRAPHIQWRGTISFSPLDKNIILKEFSAASELP